MHLPSVVIRQSLRPFNAAPAEAAMSAKHRNLYEILGVPVKASAQEIRSAYRQQALLTHPDKGGTNDAFQAVLMAFETLSSGHCRALYDARLGSNGWGSQTWSRKRGREQENAEGSTHADKPRQSSASRLHKPTRVRQSILQRALGRLQAALTALSVGVRRQMLQELPSTVRSTLLKHMEEAAHCTPGRGKEGTGTGVGRALCDGRPHPDRGDAPISSSENDSELSALSSQESMLALEDSRAFSEDSDKERDAELEQLGANDTESREAEDKDVGGQASCLSDSENKRADRRTHRVGAGCPGVWKRRGKYSASVFIRNILVICSLSTLEKAIEVHTMLVSLKEHVDEDATSTSDFAGSFRRAWTSAFQEHGLSVTDLTMSFYVRLSVHKFSGTHIDVPYGFDMDLALKAREALLAAKQEGWPSFRAAWIQILTTPRSNASGKPMKVKTTEEAAIFADAVYERGNPLRERESMRAKLKAERARRRVEKATKAVEKALASAARAQAEAAALEAVGRDKLWFESMQARMRWERDRRRTFGEIMQGPSTR